MASFECEICSKKFSHKGKFNRHKLTHTGLKLFKCDECGAALSTNHALKRHKNSHSGLKPFICGECGKTFTSKDHLHRHLKNFNHNKPLPKVKEPKEKKTPKVQKAREGREHNIGNWVCPAPFCFKFYTTSFNLRTHIRTSHEARGFECSSCSKEIMHMHNLKKHKSKCTT